VPLLLMGTAAYLRARAIVREQIHTEMTTAARAQLALVDNWIVTRQQQLLTASQRPELLDLLAQAVRLASSGRIDDATQQDLRATLVDLRERSGETVFSEVLVARTQGGQILSATNPEWEGQTLTSLTSGGISASQMETLPLHDDPLLSPASFTIATSVPIASPDVVLVGVNSGFRLVQMISALQASAEDVSAYRAGNGQTFLVYKPDLLIAPGSFEPTVQTGVAHPVLSTTQTDDPDSLEYTNPEGVAVLGAYQWVRGWNLAIVNEVHQNLIYGGLASLAPFTAVLLGIAAVFTVVVVIVATNRLLRPLGPLTEFAERISRRDWEFRVAEDRKDELGVLGKAFNRMAQELGGLYRSMEERVAERTKEIRTAAEVARESAAIRDVDRLLDETVRLISDRFGFYHAGIFLIDATSEQAVLRAASSEGGKRMLARGHSLGVGKVGIVGYVTGTGNPRIALDVGTDAVHFANPDLPETRSEMALPLRTGERIIGALDVQSTEPNAFDENDVLALQTMADQVAVAIENASLIETETRRAAQRRRIIEVSRQITQELGFAQVVAQASPLIQQSFEYDRVTFALVEGPDVVVRSSAAAPPLPPEEVGKMIIRGQGALGRAVSLRAPILIADLAADPHTPPGRSPDEPNTALAVPLLSRNQVIGALAVERREPGSLDEEDAELLETLSGLVAVALENARLFEETQQSLAHVDALYRQQSEETWRHLLAAKMSGSVKTQFEYSQRPRDREARPEDPRLQAPINLRGEILGSLEVEGPKSARQWADDDQEIVHAVAEEVGFALEQARLMEEIHRRATQLRTASEIARDVTSILELDPLLHRVINLLRDRFGFAFVAAYLVDDARKRAVLREATGEAGAKLLARGASVTIGDGTILGQAAKTGEAYLAHDTSQDPRFKPEPLLPDTQTELVLPLKTGDRVIGLLDVQHNRPHTFSEDDVAVLQILTDQLGVAVQNARSYADAMRRARLEEAVLELTSRIRATHDIDDILQTAVQEIRRTLGARQAVIRLAANLGQPEEGGDGASPMPRAPKGNGQPRSAGGDGR
jgi:GAF domain-containing protein/HAMP domain-containing protein